MPQLSKLPVTQTRRSWIALAGAASLGAYQNPQNTPPVPDKAISARGLTPEAMMQKAQADVRAASDKLASVDVPMTIEPAFQFKP
ncbi:MAG TPA: hypothetical protein VH325_01140 [Bryobacteraceae bacterium]|jgi:hypothetical protein|nr:hypothetical protein [Bryobacteraceae bacterium]